MEATTQIERLDTVTVSGRVVGITTTAGRDVSISLRTWRTMANWDAEAIRCEVLAKLDEGMAA